MARYESLEEALPDSKEELSAETGQLTNLQRLSFNLDEMCSRFEEDADRGANYLH